MKAKTVKKMKPKPVNLRNERNLEIIPSKTSKKRNMQQIS